MTINEFENNWITNLEKGNLKSFPNDFLSGEEIEHFELPETSLIKSPELFGSFEVLDSSGNPILQSNNLDRIKFVLYANRKKPARINIPKDEKDITKLVKQYEKYLDNIVKEIETDFHKYFSSSKNFLIVSNKIFIALNLYRY
jgi:hypothetical protein